MIFMRLKDKISIITGGGRGIGKAMAKRFAEEGSIVILAGRSNEELESAIEEIKNIGGNGIFIQADISRISDVQSLVKKVIEKYSKIDILVNNAGIIIPIGPIHEVNVEDWEKNIRTNVFGIFYCIKTVLPYMISKNYGKIINISGGGAFKTMPNFSAYGASKAAIVRINEIVAAEVMEHNICVNAIAPGAIKTKITYDIIESGNRAGIEAERAREVVEKGDEGIEKVTELAIFLASDESSGLSGKTISARWDDLDYIKKNISDIQNSDKYTMKRMV
jgi:NAD(P)-dependent dehydrogenase (short-subunit alcohol dehydrogenase family)